MKLTWIELSEEDKLAYKSYCESKYGEPFITLPSGVPVYLDGDDNMTAWPKNLYRYEDLVGDFIRDNRSKKLEDILKLLNQKTNCIR